MTWNIDMGLYSVKTEDDILSKMEYGRNAAGFITVRELDGSKTMLNVRNIISIREANDNGTITLDALAGEILDNTMRAVFGPKNQETETVKVNDEEGKE